MLVELCDVGGKREMGWGVSSEECCSSGGGDGLKVILVRFTTQTQRKRQSSGETTGPFKHRGQYVYELISGVGTASFVVLVCLSGET